MTKEQIVSKYSEAALAESAGKAGAYVRCDNFRDIEFKLRQACFADAEYVEVGYGLVEATYTVERNGKKVERKQVFYVQ